jgi:hypothetical protein
MDAHETTHTNLRPYGTRQTPVHRIDSRTSRDYFTGCGTRLPKTAGVLTDSAVTCRHPGCPAGTSLEGE